MSHFRRFLEDYRALRWAGLSRRRALWVARPTRWKAIFALLHGNPVMFRMLIEDGALVFEGVHGAIVTECTVRVTEPLPPTHYRFENNTLVGEPAPDTEVRLT